METKFGLVLQKERQADMVAALSFMMWFLYRHSQLREANNQLLLELTDQLARAQHATPGEFFSMSFDELMNTYTAAQYMAGLIKTPAGAEYMEHLFSDKRDAAWKEEMRDYFQATCMYMINECNGKFGELPDFARERMELEKQLKLLLG